MIVGTNGRSVTVAMNTTIILDTRLLTIYRYKPYARYAIMRERQFAMAADSKIEWCDATFNPWVGCTKISTACDHCYAESWAKRTGGAHLWQGERRRTTASNWQQPVKWNRDAERAGIRRRVFCASLADVFDNQVPDAWRRDLWHLVSRTPHLDWQLLTKRPQNIAMMLPDESIGAPAWGNGWPNVWLGTTVANQEEAVRNIPHLLAISAAKRFLSCEPLLGPLNLRAVDIDGWTEADALRPSTWRETWEADWSPAATGMPLHECIRDFVEEGGQYPPNNIRPHGIDWVIVGGESGPGARPMHPDWARSLRDQCHAASVSFFMKQMTKKSEIPADLLIREFPA